MKLMYTFFVRGGYVDAQKSNKALLVRSLARAALANTGVVFLVLLLSACRASTAPQALGTLERDRIVLKATAAELIVQLPIAQGQDVKPGDVLAQLDTRRQTAQVAKAQAHLASASAAVAKWQRGARGEEIAAAAAQESGARAQWLEAQKNYSRSVSLTSQQLMGQAQLDAARAKRDSAQALLNEASEKLALLSNGSRVEDVQQALAQQGVAQAALDLELQALADLSVRATRAGRLDLLPKHLGERVVPGETLAIILDDVAPYARVYIPESARLTAIPGRHYNVQVDGLAQPQRGTLRWVAQEPAFTPYFALNSADRSRLVYVAEIQLEEGSKNLPSGIPVQVSLVADAAAHD